DHTAGGAVPQPWERSKVVVPPSLAGALRRVALGGQLRQLLDRLAPRLPELVVLVARAARAGALLLRPPGVLALLAGGAAAGGAEALDVLGVGAGVHVGPEAAAAVAVREAQGDSVEEDRDAEGADDGVADDDVGLLAGAQR